jgi:hypothetical protein
MKARQNIRAVSIHTVVSGRVYCCWPSAAVVPSPRSKLEFLNLNVTLSWKVWLLYIVILIRKGAVFRENNEHFCLFFDKKNSCQEITDQIYVIFPTPGIRVLEKLIVSRLVKKYSVFFGMWRLTAVFRRAHQWTLSSPHPHALFLYHIGDHSYCCHTRPVYPLPVIPSL